MLNETTAAGRTSTVVGTRARSSQSQGQHATEREMVEEGKAGYARVNVLRHQTRSDWTDPGPAAIRKATSAAKAGRRSHHAPGPEGPSRTCPGILNRLRRQGTVPGDSHRMLRGSSCYAPLRAWVRSSSSRTGRWCSSPAVDEKG